MKVIVRRLLGLDYADEIVLDARQRRALALLFYNAPLALFAGAIVLNYANVYLVALGATNTQVGLLGALSQVSTAVAPLLAAVVSERTRAYKANVVLAAFSARLLFIPLALLPSFALGAQAVGIAIALLTAYGFLLSWVTAPWTAFVARLVPLEIRANYFAARNFAGGLATILGTLFVGQIVSALGFPLGFQVAFIVSLVVGLGANWNFLQIPSPSEPTSFARASGGMSIQHSLRETAAMFSPRTRFGRFLWAACAFAFAANIGGPFIQVYQVRVLGFSAGLIGLLLSLEQLVNISAQRVYGAVVIKKFGDFRVMRLLRLLTAVVPLGWIFVRDPLAAVVISVIAALVWSGHDLANFNCQLDVTPEDRRASFIAVYTFAVSLFTAAGPAIGGVLTEVIGYQALFALSAGLRVLAAGLLTFWLRDMAAPRTAAAA
ncbi:MAG: MFS transporter, partial [Thermoflexales bacterium]|nr:MFS transporter [Thermoflexales bacterium]